MFSIFSGVNRLNLLPRKMMRIEKWIKQYQQRMAFDLLSLCPPALLILLCGSFSCYQEKSS